MKPELQETFPPGAFFFFWLCTFNKKKILYVNTTFRKGKKILVNFSVDGRTPNCSKKKKDRIIYIHCTNRFQFLSTRVIGANTFPK